jgi:hypothetical protein
MPKAKRGSKAAQKKRVHHSPTPPPQLSSEDEGPPPVEPDIIPDSQPDNISDTFLPDLTPSSQDITVSKKTRRNVILSDDEEEDLAEWIRGHPAIYDKQCKAYRDIRKKEVLWTEKASAMDMEGRNSFFFAYIYMS